MILLDAERLPDEKRFGAPTDEAANAAAVIM
jgi:hypothetical protein